MIPTTHQLNPAPKRTEKRILKHQHEDGIKAIHQRGADLLPAEYLIVHQTDEERGHKIRALAKQKIAQRNAKRLAHARF